MKKQLLKNGIFLFTALVLALFIFIGYILLFLPDVGPVPEITFNHSEARIKRGAYLANAVSVCMDCHSTREWDKFSGPLKIGTIGAGGEIFNQEFGFPGVFYSKNITPYGIGNWTDGELVRAITAGVTKEGKALFPVMPHPNYGKMDQEDIFSIIAYLRTLQPIETKIPESAPDFPMNIILNTLPKPANFTKIPDTTNLALYGQYLFNAAACSECHTKAIKGEKVAGMDLAGGFEFKLPSGTVTSANITPDPETGIGSWNETTFVNRFKAFADSNYIPKTLGKDEVNTVMPWMMYAKMTDKDLKAIYAYLKTVKPIQNKIERYKKK